jgi:hypothetical protein
VQHWESPRAHDAPAWVSLLHGTTGPGRLAFSSCARGTSARGSNVPSPTVNPASTGPGDPDIRTRPIPTIHAKPKGGPGLSFPRSGSSPLAAHEGAPS